MKKVRRLLLTLLLVIFLVGCGSKTTKPTEKDNNKKQETKVETIEDKVDKQMSNMTLDEKIAQMLVIYYLSDNVDDTLKDVLETYNPGGFILMGDNYSTFDNSKKFVDDLKKYSEIPMIIATDEEGGLVQRLKNITDIGVTDIPDMYDVGKTGDTSKAKAVAKVLAEELRTLGINVTFAPVADVWTNPDNEVIGERAFGTDSETVSTMAIAFNQGLEENGIMGCFKHFPGHGDTLVDSHKALPVVNKTYDDIKQVELIPFKNAIDNGAKMIMVGHIALPNITGDDTPASLSKKIVTDILKTDLKYDGLIITDALNMGALTDNYTDEEIITMAINAGADLLLMPNGTAKTIEYIKNSISEDRIDKSVKKILLYKYTNLDSYSYLDKSTLGSEEHKSIVNSIYE
ncbi:MAG: glycoside hydrolase family 3 protein [Bacilli bacterium]|nr:glycoside hydrolase family 3 protein [Bacilli bacterium]